MIRMQIHLSSSQHRDLKREAKAAGVSMSEFVRRIVADRLEGHQRVRDHDREAIMSFIGLGDGGTGNAAAEHDRALDEAFRAGQLR
jgi:hypothetical protein